MVMISYYDILGVRVHATGEEIREAYRRRVLECHPDKGGNAEEFKKVREAYETLSNPVERESYDQFLYYIRLHEFMARVNESTRTEEDVTAEEQDVQQEEMDLGKGSQGPSLHKTSSHSGGVFSTIYAIMVIVYSVTCLVARLATSDDGHYHIQQRKARTAYSFPRTGPSRAWLGRTDKESDGWTTAWQYLSQMQQRGGIPKRVITMQIRIL